MGISTAPVELIWIFRRSDAGAAFGRFEKGRAGLSIGPAFPVPRFCLCHQNQFRPNSYT
jgi:hypothetical protein